MEYVILQYVLVCLLVVGVGYLLYLLKDKGEKFSEDYFGVTHNILKSLQEREKTTKSVKNILRIVSKTVFYVEDRYRNEDNEIKERRALKLSKEALEQLDLNKKLDEDSIIYMIRISAAMMPSRKIEKS